MEVFPWTGRDEGLHGRLECSYYNWTSRWTGTFHELVQEIENMEKTRMRFEASKLNESVC